MPTRLATFAGPDARRLVLVRHGRTAWNLTRRAQGHTDIPLDEVGHRQAAAMAPAVAALRPSRLWSSDLARAAQSGTSDLVDAVKEIRRRDRSAAERPGPGASRGRRTM